MTTLSAEIRSKLSTNFTKCVKGYHLINDDPIKEAPWEDINAIILKASGCPVVAKSNGSHKSGGDLSCSLGEFSNKSTKYGKNKAEFSISSYRLTTVCSDKNPGKIEDILAEIDKRKNFSYYSIILRDESDKEITYDWYLIPSDYAAFSPSSYEWRNSVGKTKKKKDTVTGWETNAVQGSSMSITFSMSSQLWINVQVTEELKKHIVGTCTVERKRKYDYISLYEKEVIPVPPLA